MAPLMRTGNCRSCAAVIVWAESASGGGRMPVDAEPVAGGNVALTPRAGRSPLARVFGADDVPGDDEARYTNHFATCPQADDWRNRQ